jgi:iron(III) transport system substrate-binding protein
MRKALVLSAVLALGLTACGAPTQVSTQAQTTDYATLQDLVTAAEAEGSVRLYTSLLEPDLVKLVAGFEAKYKIDVEDVRLGGTDAMNRFDSESAAKAKTADVVLVNDTSYFGTATEKGIITPLDQTGVLKFVPDFPKDMLLEKEKTAVLTITNNGLAYNSDLVDAKDVPKSWEDLLDPKWKGKILMVSPDASLANVLTWDIVAKSQGDDYLKKLGGQVARYYPNLVPMHEALAAGEGQIALPSPEFYAAAQKAGGKPLGFGSLSPNYYPAQAVGVATAAEHPAAARLLTEYLLSEEGIATITAGAGVFSPYDKDVPADFKVPSADEIKDVQSRQEKIAAQFKG